MGRVKQAAVQAQQALWMAWEGASERDRLSGGLLTGALFEGVRADHAELATWLYVDDEREWGRGGVGPGVAGVLEKRLSGREGGGAGAGGGRGGGGGTQQPTAMKKLRIVILRFGTW